MKLNLKKIIIFSGILIFVAVLNLAYFFVVPSIINIEKYKPEVREYLKENISVPLELGKLDIDMTWNLGVKIKIDKAILQKSNGKQFVNIGDSYIEVSLIPLINKHVVIRQVFINSPDINLKRLEDGTFDLAKIFIKRGKSKYKVELKDTSIILNNYKINFIDKVISPAKEFVLNGEILKITRFTPNKYIEIEAKGKVSECQKPEMNFNLLLNTDLPLRKKNPTTNQLKIKGNIVNFDLAEFKPYINKYAPNKYIVLDGTGNVNFDIDLNKEILGRRRFFIESKTSNLNIVDALRGDVLSYDDTLHFFTSGSFDDNDLYLDNLQVNGDKINTDIKGKISNFARKKIRNIDLRVDVNATRAKIAAEVFPKTIKVKLDPFNKIIKHNIDGNISGNLQLKGYYRKPDIFGKVKYDDFSIIEKLHDTPNGYGTVDFLGPTLVINSKQYLGKNEFIQTTGHITPFKGKRLKLAISSTQNINFAKCLPVLLAVRDIFQFKLTPVTEMDIKGIGKTNLNIEGAFKDVTINGYVEVKNASVKYKTLAGSAENVNGKVKFVGEKVYYDDLIGFVDGIKLIPSGYSTLHGYSDVKLYMPQLDLKKGQKFVYGSPLLDEVQIALKDIIDIKGVADTAIFLKGTDKNLDSNGIIKFNDAFLKYKGYGEPFSKLKGQLRYKNEDIYFDNINGNVLENNVTVSGFVGALSKNIDMTISSKIVRLEDAKKFVMNSFLLAKSQKIVKDYTFVKGTAQFLLVLKGKSDQDCLKSLIFSNTDAVFENKQVGFPVKISQGVINITDDTVQTQGIQARAGNTDFTVQGKVSNLKANIKKKGPILPDLQLKIRRFDATTLNELAKIPVIPSKIKKMLSGVTHSDGYADVFVHIKPSGFNANLNFNNLAMIYQNQDLPFIIENGKAEITDKSLFFSDINGKIANSDFFINGNIKNYSKKPVFAIVSSLKINPDDVNRLSSLLKQPVGLEGIIPITANIKGNVDNWNIQGKMALAKGINLSYARQMGIPDDKVRMLTLDAQGKQDKIDVKSLKIDLCDKDKDLSYKTPWEFDVDGEKENLLHFSGSIDKLKTFKPVFKNFRVFTNEEKPLSMCILNTGVSKFINNGNENFFSEGNFQANLIINGYVFSPAILGSISFSGLKIPDYKLSLNNANIDFSKDEISFDFKDLKIDDSSMNISALVNYPIETPLMLKNINIISDYMNIDKIAGVLISNKNIVDDNKENIKMPEFIIKNGTLDSKELIMRDLITSNVKANINLTPDGLLSVSDIQMNAAGGVGAGNIYYNTKSSELSLNLIAKNMQANALATTLLRFPNEVYGTLNGEGQFYTSGRNSEEMISNSNGYANFKIYDGRLVRLGSMEYFLRAANVLQCGIGGFNFNNIIDLVVPQKTGYFDKLEGRLDIKDGVINTDEITSSGENLSLFISGNFDMLTNNADTKILGTLSKKVSGLLGPLGSVSVNQFIGFVPGVGFLPTIAGEKGLIDLIPGLSKIPVLGLDYNQRNRQFVVDINGNLYEQSSVKSFRWLD